MSKNANGDAISGGPGCIVQRSGDITGGKHALHRRFFQRLYLHPLKVGGLDL